MKKVPQIESVRILAMAGIFLYHVWSVVPASGNENPFGPVFGLVISQGYLGVIVFNMITGFVLSLPHLPPQGRPAMSYPDFFRRRFGRICPQYYLSLALWSAAAFAAGAMPAGALFVSLAEHAFFVQTFDPGRFFSLVPAFWWMGLLAQFYLLFPVVLRAMLRFGPGRTLLCVCLLCWGGWRVMSILVGVFPHGPLPMVEYMMSFNIPGRLPEFVLGMFLAAVWKANAARPGALARLNPETGLPRVFIWAAPLLAIVLIAAACLYKNALPAPLDLMLLTAACLGTGLALFSQPFLARLGRTPRAAAWAAASYSFYLLHQPLLDYGVKALGERFSPFTAFCLLSLVCAPLASLMARLQDRLTARILRPSSPAAQARQ